MILPNNDTGVRPAGRNDACFYCGEFVQVNAGGAFTEHKPDCVCLSRTVVAELKIWFVAEVPQDWDERQINFKFNESSHCIGNEIRQIAAEDDREANSCCTCFRAETKYLREATADDHEQTRWVALGDRNAEAAAGSRAETAFLEAARLLKELVANRPAWVDTKNPREASYMLLCARALALADRIESGEFYYTGKIDQLEGLNLAAAVVVDENGTVLRFLGPLTTSKPLAQALVERLAEGESVIVRRENLGAQR